MSMEKEVRSNQIIQLFKYTPCLKHLSTLTDCNVNENYISHTFPTLTRLQVKIRESFNLSEIDVFFSDFGRLRYLDINTGFTLLNGYEWEAIIQNLLFKLRVLKFKMIGVFPQESIEQEVGELIDSYQTSF
ncbi:unnamed protein product [Adineta steineri]|uniref:Uncharacterized protein n=1 Tax=Adineta steineri TaxID=433720 RepID=A0A815BGA8_9BILA|nr:unnamed protein product [Adineta steineri]